MNLLRMNNSVNLWETRKKWTWMNTWTSSAMSVWHQATLDLQDSSNLLKMTLTFKYVYCTLTQKSNLEVIKSFKMRSVQNDELWCLKMEDWRKEIWPSERSFQHLKLSVTKDMGPRLIHYSTQMQEQSGWKRLSEKTFSEGLLISWSKALEWYTHTHTHTYTHTRLKLWWYWWSHY